MVGTASLNLRNERLLRAIISRSQDTFLGPALTLASFEKYDSENSLKTARFEFEEDNQRFFRHFFGRLGCEQLRGRDILDVGCGYGGRSVYYALECGARSIHGIDIVERCVTRSALFAEQAGAGNASFSLMSAEELGFPDGSVDCVLSFDALEHASDPAAAIREMCRVLRPGGDAWVVFPTYRGARTSHLDYITRVPALHRIFHPDTIIKVVNEILETEGERLGTLIQPKPGVSNLGHYTLPWLNGMTLRESRRLFRLAGFEIVGEWVTPLVDPQLTLAEVRRNVGDKLPLALTVRGLALLLYGIGRLVRLPDLLIQNIAFHATVPRRTPAHSAANHPSTGSPG